MLTQSWSLRGSRHRDNNVPNQDAVCLNQTERYEVAAIADGVSTCSASFEGALLAARCVADTLTESGEQAFSAQLLLDAVSDVLHQQSNMTKKPLRDYSSTLAAAVWDKQENKLFYMSLGDSLLLTVSDSKCSVLAAPCDSTYGIPTTTHRHAFRFTQSKTLCTDGIDSVIILTDGAWKPLFYRTKMLENIQTAIENGNYHLVRAFLENANVSDDATAVILKRES